MMDKELLNKIYKLHIKQLKNLSIPHKKLVICFSGIAGSGKTYIAKILEEKYNGVRIRNDDIREIIRGINKEIDIDEAVYNYLGWFSNNYKFQNELLILDSGIERKYLELFPYFKKKGFVIFIIRLKVHEKVYQRRIIEKLGKLDNNYLTRIKSWKKQYKEFGKRIKSDIIIKNNKDNRLNLNNLFKKLDKFIPLP
jgi:predicted kinase